MCLVVGKPNVRDVASLVYFGFFWYWFFYMEFFFFGIFGFLLWKGWCFNCRVGPRDFGDVFTMPVDFCLVEWWSPITLTAHKNDADTLISNVDDISTVIL